MSLDVSAGGAFVAGWGSPTRSAENFEGCPEAKTG